MIEFWVAPNSPYHKPIFSQPDHNLRVLLHSGLAVCADMAMSQDMGFDASHLNHGFVTWVDAEYDVETVNKP